MKSSLLLSSVATLIFFAPAAAAKSPNEIEKIAKSVSVQIQVDLPGGEYRSGSGSIIHHQGNTYTLVTNRHVACGNPQTTVNPNVVQFCTLPQQQAYTLTTADGQKYRVTVASVKLIGRDLDLAMMQFRSSRTYPVAQLADPDRLKVNDEVYTAGFPRGQGWLFGKGKARAVVNKRLQGDRGGYTVIYNAETLPGMSGGGAFDQDGRLVAVHGQGDRYTENTEADVTSFNAGTSIVGNKIGYNRGIPVLWVMQGLSQKGILLGNARLPRQTENSITIATTADELFIAGFNKYIDPGQDFQVGRKVAVDQFSRAIALNPRYTIAYFMRGYVKSFLKDPQGALADYDRAIALDPQFSNAYNSRGTLKQSQLGDPTGALADYDRAIALSPKFALAYYNRGYLQQYSLNKPQQALADYDRVIALNPRYIAAYNNRGLLKKERLKDYPSALVDYNRAIALNPKFAVAYSNRGSLKVLLNDSAGALADFNQVISIMPKHTLGYYNRGLLKVQLKDSAGAMADFDRAIAFSPKFASAYMNRGSLKARIKDYPGALTDYDRAISLNPKFAQAYTNRGTLKVLLNDFPGALADFDRAIVLNPQFAENYLRRGMLKYKNLNDSQGGIVDFRLAAKIYRKNGQVRESKVVVNALRALGATE